MQPKAGEPNFERYHFLASLVEMTHYWQQQQFGQPKVIKPTSTTIIAATMDYSNCSIIAIGTTIARAAIVVVAVKGL